MAAASSSKRRWIWRHPGESGSVRRPGCTSFHGGIAPQKLVTGAPYLPHTAAPQHGFEVITAEVLSAAQLPLHLVEPRADERRPGSHEEDYQRVAGQLVPRCRRIAQNSRR